MNVIANLFPGLAEHRIPTEDAAEIFVRTGGSGPPLLLLHGYPQTHVCWHKIAPELARHVTLVLADLRGYGTSSAPRGSAEHKTYSKRSMAADCLAVMRALGHRRFTVRGHDRGGRVAYRLAFDHPEAICALVPIAILPTAVVWRDMTAGRAISGYHWAYLAQPYPLPETLIGRQPIFYLEHALKSWAGPRDLSPFIAEALAHYRALLKEPARLRAVCEETAPVRVSIASSTRRIWLQGARSCALPSRCGAVSIWIAAEPTPSKPGKPGARRCRAPGRRRDIFWRRRKSTGDAGGAHPIPEVACWQRLKVSSILLG